jgi:hypothetical protein
MTPRSLALKIIVAVAALTACPCLRAQDGLEGALTRANLASPAHLWAPFPKTLAAADFDGDNKPDGAVLVDYGWCQPQGSVRTIELHFTGRGNTSLTFESNEAALTISALDVNRDGAADIVVEQPLTHKRLQVWLNDGRGGFHKVLSQDFQSADLGNHERLEPPSPRSDFPAFGLTSQRSYDLGILKASTCAHRSSSAREQSLPFEALVGSTAITQSSPRAPPRPHSL